MDCAASSTMASPCRRARAASAGADAAGDGEPLLERPPLAAQDELAGVEHARHRGEELRAERRVLAAQVDERDHFRRAPDSLAPRRVDSTPPTPSRLSVKRNSLSAVLPPNSGLRLMYSSTSAQHWNFRSTPKRLSTKVSVRAS